MTKLSEIVGDIIFISLRDPKRYKNIGILTDSGHYLFKGYDQMGIWVKHPGIVVKNTEDIALWPFYIL